jgi:protein involved in polysaccharide export with SLBB domain
MTMLRRISIILGIALALPLAGCASTKRANEADRLNAWMMRQKESGPLVTYKVQPPDKLAIVAPRIKELDGQVQTIRPDGKISLNLIGEVFVSGKTPEQIAAELRTLAAKYYNPDMLDISVRIEEFASQVVYVFGQVQQPGIKPYTGRDTIITILAEAQLNSDAWPQRIVIVRPHEDVNVKQKVTVDLKEMYATGQTSQDFLLEPGDVIYVPPSPLAQLNTNFEKVMIPIRPALSLSSLAYGGI